MDGDCAMKPPRQPLEGNTSVATTPWVQTSQVISGSLGMKPNGNTALRGAVT